MPISGLTGTGGFAPPARRQAILLLGPTGSGKTPLGEMIAARGLKGRRCLHFDFGAELRRQAALGAGAGVLTPGETAFIRRVLETGALLEDDRFPLVIRILEAFLERGRPSADGWIVLNGIPRHAGQARDLERVIEVRRLVELVCDAASVMARIRGNTGGDRDARADDDPEGVRRRLRFYEERTRPLAVHYAAGGAAIRRIRVVPASTAATMYGELTALPW